MQRDDLDLFIAKRAKANPLFTKAVDDALHQRKITRHGSFSALVMSAAGVANDSALADLGQQRFGKLK